MQKHLSFSERLFLRVPLLPLRTSYTGNDLLQLVKSNLFREALFLSAPDLLFEFERLTKAADAPAKMSDILISLNKYALRASSRCTPFGLFAGISSCEWGEPTEIKISPVQDISRKTKLDMYLIGVLIQKLNGLEAIRNTLKYYPNSTLYYIHDRLRYVESVFRENIKIINLSEVISDDHLLKIIELTEKGATKYELVAFLAGDGITNVIAETYINELIDAQIIVSEIEPNVTGPDVLIRITEILKKYSSGVFINRIISNLGLIQDELTGLDRDVVNDITRYEKVINLIRELDLDFEKNKLVHVSHFRPCKVGTISYNVRDQLMDGLTVLNKLTNKGRSNNLENFKKRFSDRYESKEVPLSEALDVELGIGYLPGGRKAESPLVDDITKYLEKPLTNISLNKIQEFLHKKLVQAYWEKKDEIIIQDVDLHEFEDDWTDISSSMSVIFSVFNDNGIESIQVRSAFGNTGIRILGRFADLSDDIYDTVKEIHDYEETANKGKIIAEIVHLPEERTGNVLFRPVFSTYEIPYLAKSILKKEHQINIQDLYISLQNDKIVLRSKSLNKEIIPRLGNAHNYNKNSLPVYQFLCDLQNQNLRSSLAIDWGDLHALYPFIPRIKYKDIILSLATWNIQTKSIEFIKNCKNDHQLVEEVANWKLKWNIPDIVVLADGDNELVINLREPLCINMLYKTVKARQIFKLQEFNFSDKRSIVTDSQGNKYTNELIAVFYNSSNNRNDTPVPVKKTISDYREPRTLSIGSQWLYYKIYTGVKTANRLLDEIIAPVVNELKTKTILDKWFFIRYNDPEFHLRVRFHLKDRKDLNTVILTMHDHFSTYINKKSIWRIQCDTYNREMERYGPDLINESEQVFEYDSEYVMNALRQLNGIKDKNYSWLLCIKSIDTLLEDFGLTPPQKFELMHSLKTGFESEFKIPANKELKIKISDKYRHFKNSILNILSGKYQHLEFFKGLLEARTSGNKQIKESILKKYQEKDPGKLLASYIHMHVNRMLSEKHRLNELTIYTFLYNVYKTALFTKK